MSTKKRPMPNAQASEADRTKRRINGTPLGRHGRGGFLQHEGPDEQFAVSLIQQTSR